MKNFEKYIDMVRKIIDMDHNCYSCPVYKLNVNCTASNRKECNATFMDWAMNESIGTETVVDSDSRTVWREFNSTKELIDEYKRRFDDKSIMPNIWIRRKDGNKRLVTATTGRMLVVTSPLGNGTVTLLDLFEYYVFLDGSPCGMEVSND